MAKSNRPTYARRSPAQDVRPTGAFPNRVRAMREKANLSRRVLVAKAGNRMTEHHLLRLERWAVPLAEHTAVAMAAALGVDPAALYHPTASVPVSRVDDTPKERLRDVHQLDVAIVLPSTGEVLGGASITLDGEVLGRLLRAAIRGALKG